MSHINHKVLEKTENGDVHLEFSTAQVVFPQTLVW